MATTRRRSRRALDRVIGLLDALLPARPHAVVHSSPDLDDSIVALLRARPHDLEVVVLAEDPRAASSRLRALGLVGVRIVSRRSWRGSWAYLRSQVLVSTHGMFGCRPRGRDKQSVGLWHGEFGKLIGTFAGEAPRHFDWVPVSSPLSRSLRSAEFGLDLSRIQVVGSPRQRLITAPGPALAGDAGTRRIVVWAPTYRTSVSGMIRSDGDPDALARNLPLDDPDLLALLRRHDATLWYRDHPSAAQTAGPLTAPWVRSATNAHLEELGVAFYDVLGLADCFITDYSSLWIDFVLRDRPLVAFCPDLDRYRDDRGLALEPHEEWFPGPVIRTRDALLAALDLALSDPASGGAERARSRAVLHTATSDPVESTWVQVRAAISALGRA
ncbi:CDP-glycerol glycerophosphotransferase family protein [soil metagenome]